ncbi:hypothetical protein CK203_089825 [Vitis vinifera]|uniref:Extracellular ligand-gated ion channel n=1 Tax=Vitis vinifera TaxID=29760 RepID=A0A438D3E4_VITVI|nr:hypothetical protein CK203_089825 [Vitis vinifera]
MGDERERLLRKNKFQRSISYAQDELQSFRSWLRWMCVDQSTISTGCLSWSVFILLAIAVPVMSHFLLACSSCDAKHQRPYDAVVQLSLSSVAVLSFLCLSRFIRNYGLRRFLFFDKLRDESEMVRTNYTEQLNVSFSSSIRSKKLSPASSSFGTHLDGYHNHIFSYFIQRSMKILSLFVLPCFAAEATYKIWWYSSGRSRIPFLGNVYVSDVIACTLELCSWLYRTSVFFLVCVLFRLICHLQILRLQDFARVFQAESDVESVLREHLRIRRHLRIISHRNRVFILFALMFVTASQFASLLSTTRSRADVNMFTAGELALCSITLVTGLLVLFRGATKITHKAQAITCLAAKWHVCATIDSFESNEPESPRIQIPCPRPFPSRASNENDVESDGEDAGDEEDDVDSTKLIPAYASSTISFQKRQALEQQSRDNGVRIHVGQDIAEHHIHDRDVLGPLVAWEDHWNFLRGRGRGSGRYHTTIPGFAFWGLGEH